jgi:hypothetical protein
MDPVMERRIVSMHSCYARGTSPFPKPNAGSWDAALQVACCLKHTQQASHPSHAWCDSVIIIIIIIIIIIKLPN